ncbi:hypothetical protein OESDEN_07448 [Oesophagostomum dentatum]|uniref:Leucine Rich repeat-containing domain protein n=1 Tax=Oesophagostomum dentatum TaxID=61180 RepID=A0A0B1T970_OESDE|nr:hypothetical protein OESDEN_07448 [Oesophagostomum dentatum]
MAKTPGFLTFLDKQIRMDSAEDAEEIAETIESCSNLKTLELRGNTVGVEAGKRLASALEMHPELEVGLDDYHLRFVKNPDWIFLSR